VRFVGFVLKQSPSKQLNSREKPGFRANLRRLSPKCS